ncbi:MAG: hypothetical protein ACHQC8_05810 [Solirubrobacterales bacterium]
MLGSLLLAASLASGSSENLLLGRRVQGSGLAGSPSVVTNGHLRPEGEVGSPAHTAILKSPESHLYVDLGETREIRGLIVQFDADDVYLIERSTDGQHWSGLLRIEAGLSGAGLRTRYAVLPTPLPAKFLLVHAEGGDGRFFVSQLQAYSKLPSPWPPELIEDGPAVPVLSLPTVAAPPGAQSPVLVPVTPVPRHAPPPVVNRFTETKMTAVKGLLAASGLGLLTWGYALKRSGRGAKYRQARDVLLAALGILGLASWWNLGHYHFESYVHTWDTFHYYIGAKYQPELGYTRLYECAVAADVAAVRVAPSDLVTVTNLETNHLEPLLGAKAVEGCLPYFSPERWRSFIADVEWFHDRSGTQWQSILSDHGYNGTPAWGILGGILANTGPASSDQIGILATIDSALLVTMWVVVVWAWGWRAAAVATLSWGTNYAARYWWNGGAFLRMDWLFCLVVGISLLRKERPRTAGAILCFAALLRIFPGVILIGLATTATARFLGQRRIALMGHEKRLLEGAVAALAFVLPLSVLVAGGGHTMHWSTWKEFAQNSRKHLSTPLTNNMGLETVLTYRTDTRAEKVNAGGDADPFEPWKEAHRRTAQRVKIPYLILAAVGITAFAWVFRIEKAWLVAAAAVGLIPIATELTCYYYSFLLVLALLTVERDEIGIMFTGLSLVSCIIPTFLAWDEDRYALLSLAVLVVLGAAAWFLERTKTPSDKALAVKEGWIWTRRPQEARKG